MNAKLLTSHLQALCLLFLNAVRIVETSFLAPTLPLTTGNTSTGRPAFSGDLVAG
jgi:hypothetical protein